ncbi:MAG TPA: mannitol dehydrogenase family protein [Microvirga sp.]|jgi:mannitol 2-dehydrogenase|nr:mannitol dehydrogenase family protein [Microvirga sp.]
MSIRPSNATLAELAGRVAVPRYDRAALRAGILHVGVGNFHRAHQAVYLDDLFNRGRDHDWAIVGAGVRAADARMRDALAPQDWLTTVVAREAERTDVRITGAMIDCLAPGDAGALLARLADPAIRIVSLTITEGGYYIDPATQRFDADHPDIVADARDLAAPRTVFGLVLAGLQRRRARGVPPFTVMSCDNIPGNGHVTEHAVAGLADRIDPALAAYVRGEVAFPNSMVDRITPATTDRERAILASEWGIADAWPVFCEAFRQWVVEDRFPAGRPALEEAGVQFVADVAPFEHMKIRILNGGHAAIAYPAALLDIHFVHDAMADPQVRGFLDRLEREEILPTVPPVPGTRLEDYRALIVRRFANPQIGDTIPRLCADGSNRQPKFILPAVADRLRQGAPVEGLALVGALWCRYCAGTTDSGAPVAADDPNWARVHAQAERARSDPRAFLAMEDIFGDIGRNETYAAAFAAALASLWRSGTRATLARYLGGAA